MNLTIEAIQFNHDPTSARTDAFNIRRNETEPVTVPEWRRVASVKPEDSPAAYAIRETCGNVLTIQAKFKSVGAGSIQMQVRAVDATVRHRQSLGCGPIGSFLRAFSLVRATQVGNVLGEVKERQIKFSAAGETDFEMFELKNVRLGTVGVSVSTTRWRWQFRVKPTDQWTDFAVTNHRIYTVLEVPKCPWEQTPNETDNTQLPWTDALEYACDWAASAQDTDEAATLITQNVYDLGLGPVVSSGSSLYSCPNFNCTEFLDLLSGGTGAGQTMNCSDCATVVSSFANLIGCNLRQLSLGPGNFLTRPIRLIGRTNQQVVDFFGHEVAWKGAANEEGRLFDALFQVDGDDHPESPPFVSLLPTNIRLGNTNDKDYRFRLSPRLVLLPDTLSCRKIGYSIPGDCRRLDNTLFEFLKSHYEFSTWSNLPPERPRLSLDHVLLTTGFLSDWNLKRSFAQPKLRGAVKAYQKLWHSPADKDVLLRLDLSEWPTWQDARGFMLRELGEFHFLQVERLTDPTVGDVSFVEAGGTSVLFARAQLVFLVRSAGKQPISITQIAFEIDKALIKLNSQ